MARSMPTSAARLQQALLLTADGGAAGPVAMNSGLMPNGSRAQNNSWFVVSHSANANMPRSRLSASVPQW